MVQTPESLKILLPAAKIQWSPPTFSSASCRLNCWKHLKKKVKLEGFKVTRHLSSNKSEGSKCLMLQTSGCTRTLELGGVANCLSSIFYNLSYCGTPSINKMLNDLNYRLFHILSLFLTKHCTWCICFCGCQGPSTGMFFTFDCLLRHFRTNFGIYLLQNDVPSYRDSPKWGVLTLLSLEVLYLYHMGWINNSKTWLPGVLRTSKKPPRYHNWKFAKQNGPNICSLEGPYDIKTSGRSDMSVPQTKDTLNVTRQIAKFLVRVCNLLDTWNFLAFLTHPQYGCFQK